MIEVNMGEEQKGGVKVENLKEVAEKSLVQKFESDRYYGRSALFEEPEKAGLFLKTLQVI